MRLPPPEEQDAWVRELKREWPHPGPAPRPVLPETAPTPWCVTGVWAWAVPVSAIALWVCLLHLDPLSPADGETTPVPTWPAFDPGRPAGTPRVNFSLGGTRPAPPPSLRERTLSIRNRLRNLKQTDTWRTNT